MNLLDALCSFGHECKSVVQLCMSPYFERQYSSITDAIADGLPNANWAGILALAYEYIIEFDKELAVLSQKVPRNIFILDCTAQQRSYAPTLYDKHMTHMPNPTPGNKPICVGHQYSIVALGLQAKSLYEKHWAPPLSVKKVGSHEKGNELGIKQLNDCIEELNQSQALNISVADSQYGTPKCRESVIKNENLVHIFRLRNDRNVFLQPKVDCQEQLPSKGRKQEYGDKMTLSKPETHPECEDSAQFSMTTKRGKARIISIRSWHDVLLRGTTEFRSSEHPLNLIQIVITDENNQPIYQRPLWLGVLGKRRHEVTIKEAQQVYAQRYDIEHLNRFGKQNLLMASNQTPDVSHEELWWQLCCLAYVQLFLASGIVPSIPQSWERYLPEYKDKGERDDLLDVSAPSKTQRGFANVLNTLGTPATKPVPRGNPKGRSQGETQPKRNHHDVIFKGSKGPKKNIKKDNSKDPKNKEKNSAPQTLDDLLESVQSSLKKLNLTPEAFSKLLSNTS